MFYIEPVLSYACRYCLTTSNNLRVDANNANLLIKQTNKQPDIKSVNSILFVSNQILA